MDQPPQQRPLDYASPLPPRGGSVFSVPAFLTGLAMVLLIGAVMFLVVPRIEVILADFNVRLPAVSVAYLMLARVFTRGFGWALVLPLPALLGFLAALTAPAARPVSEPRPRAWRRMSLATVVAWLLFAVFVAFTVVALLLPMVSLANSLGATR